MKYAISINSVTPLRTECSDKSEMLTQILFGELLQIFKIKGNWAFVKNINDKYEGWIDNKNLQYITEKTFKKLKTDYKTFILPNLLSTIKNINTNQTQLISSGALLHKFNKKNLSFSVGTKKYLLENPPIKLTKDIRNNVSIVAKSFINCPYLWGGKNPFGIDCSGLSQIAFSVAGRNIPRDANKQVELGTALTFVNEAQPGDLAFFDNNEGQIVHVGIIVSDSKIIHASGKVRIDNIDHEGIFNKETQRYSHKLRVIKNILD